MCTVRHVPDADEKWCPDFAYFFVYRKICIRKQWKRDFIFLFKISNFKRGIADADSDQFDPSFKFGIFLNAAIHLVDRRSLPLAKRSVHTEYLYDHDIGLDIRDFKRLFAGQP